MQTGNNDGQTGQADDFTCQDDVHMGCEVDLTGRQDGFICQNDERICEVDGFIG